MFDQNNVKFGIGLTQAIRFLHTIGRNIVLVCICDQLAVDVMWVPVWGQETGVLLTVTHPPSLQYGNFNDVSLFYRNA